ncbi:MAG: DHH family phosphoesterase [Candidatus Altiarchaeota archaeon]
MNKDMEKYAKGFTRRLIENEDFLVVSHHDADGITACAIMVDALKGKGKNVDYFCTKQLDSRSMAEIRKRNPKTIVFTDFGSGHLHLIREAELENYYIIDHHEPEEKGLDCQFNPHEFGYDGGSDISGAGMAYIVAKSLGIEDKVAIAVVGAVGDMQDSKGKFESLNREILEDAQKLKKIKVENDIRLFGRQSRTLSQMLAYASDPVLPGLSGSQTAANRFLEDLGIGTKDARGEWRNYIDLDGEEREKLTTALYIYLLDRNTPEFVIQRMIGEVYTLLDEEEGTELRDAREFSTVLNATGRQEKSELGVEVCLGDRGVIWEKAKKMLAQHRKMLREGLEFLEQNGSKSMDNLYYFDGEDSINERIIGIVAGMAYGAQVIAPDKPVLAIAVDSEDNTQLKISSRANWNLVNSGIHLGMAMREVSRELGGEGGGHDIAAGARVPKENLEKFLKEVDKKFAEQRKK